MLLFLLLYLYFMGVSLMRPHHDLVGRLCVRYRGPQNPKMDKIN